SSSRSESPRAFSRCRIRFSLSHYFPDGLHESTPSFARYRGRQCAARRGLERRGLLDYRALRNPSRPCPFVLRAKHVPTATVFELDLVLEKLRNAEVAESR